MHSIEVSSTSLVKDFFSSIPSSFVNVRKFGLKKQKDQFVEDVRLTLIVPKYSKLFSASTGDVNRCRFCIKTSVV